MRAVDLARARDALQAIPPDMPRDDWVRAAMAAKAAGLGFEDFDTWSARADSYSAAAARDVWRSIKDGKGIGPGTLFRMADDAGWRSDALPAGKRQRETPRAIPKAVEVWARCVPATADHGYITSKDGLSDGLRVVPAGDPLRIAGLPMAGALVVPVLPLAGGQPVSLQFIAPPDLAAQWKAAGKPGKLNLPRAPVAGVFVVGELAPGGLAYVVEGIGQGWACWKATGAAAVVAFGWGRVRSVATELRQRDPAARLVLVPDAGKEDDATEIAAELSAAVATMPEGWPANSDVNDLAQRDGFDALEVLLASASAPPAPPPRFHLLGADALRDLPPLAWRTRGVLPAQGLAGIYGPSGAGKSFLALDLAASSPEPGEWFGHRKRPAPVVYCCLEGEAGFRLRAAAWERATGRTLPADLRVMLQPFKLTERADVHELAAAVLTMGEGVVTIIDTLNRAAPDADENASADMGRIIEAAKELQRLTAGLVVLVHHVGKDAQKGMRGHSSLFAALDAAIEVSREGDHREWRVAKAKDGQDGEAHPFRLQVVDLGEDEDGESITSCVVVPEVEHADTSTPRPRLPKGGNQRIVLDALGPLLRQSPHFGKAGAPPQRPCIHLEAAIETAGTRLVVEPKRRRERTQQAITGLVAAGVMRCQEGWLWLV